MSDAKPDIPYTVQMSVALLMHDQKMMDKITQELFGTMEHKLIELVESYDQMDLPLVVAIMTLTANSLYAMLDDTGRRVADDFIKSTTCIAVNMEELKRQSEGE